MFLFRSDYTLFNYICSLSLVIMLLGGGAAQAQEAADSTAAAPAEAEASSGGGGDSADGIPTDDAVISQGESLFNNNCTVCHAINQQVVGPALKNVHERRDLPWLISFIKNSQKVIQSGDDYAVNLYNEYNKTVMPSFAYSDEEITSIVAYIKAESSQQTADTPPTGPPGENPPPTDDPGGIPSGYLLAILIGLVVILGLTLLVLVLIVTVLTKFLNQKTDLDEADREIIDQKTDVKKLVQSRPFIGMMLFIFMALVVKLVLDGLYSVGVQQGYQPEQPHQPLPSVLLPPKTRL